MRIHELNGICFCEFTEFILEFYDGKHNFREILKTKPNFKYLKNYN